MSRYIDADALKKRVSELIIPDWTRTLIRSWLDSAPTVDAVPVHGEWLSEWEGLEITVRCSVCGEMALIKEGGSHDHAYSHYCPNCGAKMDGKENANDAIRPN